MVQCAGQCTVCLDCQEEACMVWCGGDVLHTKGVEEGIAEAGAGGRGAK
jgi:hypothetical protein